MWLLWSSSLWIKKTSRLLLHLIPTHPLSGGTGSRLKQSAAPWTQWRNGDKRHWFCLLGATVLPIAPDFWFCLLRTPYYSFLKLLLMKKKNAPSGLYSFHCTLQTGINVSAWRLFKASDRGIFFSPGLWFYCNRHALEDTVSFWYISSIQFPVLVTTPKILSLSWFSDLIYLFVLSPPPPLPLWF